MSTRSALALAILLVSLSGCGTAARSVRLDTGQGKSLVHTPRGGGAPVELRTEKLARELTTQDTRLNRLITKRR